MLPPWRAGLEHVTLVRGELPALARKTRRPTGQPEAGCRAVFASSWASLLCAGLALSSLAQRGGADASKRQKGVCGMQEAFEIS